MPTIHINPELQSLIPALSADEYRQLEQNILADGCHDALIVWQETQTLLDGHNRHDICERHGLPYNISEISLPDLDTAKAWMISNQLGRRNLTPEQMSYFRGEQYNLRKQQGKRTDLTSTHFEEKLQSPAHILAEQHQVSRATIERDGAFARAVETIAAVAGPDARQLLLARTERLPRQVVQQLAVLTETDPDTAKALLVAAFEAPTAKAAIALIKGATTCGICHRPLTNPTSMQRGIGPVCACRDGKTGAGRASGAGSGRVSPDAREDGQRSRVPETVQPNGMTPATVHLETLLRATAQDLAAIQDGLAHGGFGETFESYGLLWDAVHDGCVHLLALLDGDPDEEIAEPASVPELPAEPQSTPVYGDLTFKVMQAARKRQQFRCGDIAKDIGVDSKNVWQVLDKQAKRGTLMVKDKVYTVMQAAEVSA